MSQDQPDTTRRAPRPSKSRHGPRLPYLPALDGLRALAVIAVLVYHANSEWARGGFLGVEVFFVISGYLITSLLLAEWTTHERVDLKGFWLRRARRLLPALYLLIIAVLGVGVVFLPDEVASLRADALAAFAYVMNWHLIFSNQSYFEAVGRPSLLRHVWSLAVEEQFYLLWPLLFFAGMRWLRQRWLLAVTLAGAIASAVGMAVLYNPDIDPSRVYYGTDTRASGLLLGAALAFVWAPWRLQRDERPSRRLAFDAAGVAGLAVLAWLCLTLTEFEPFLYQGGFALVGLATTLVIAVVAHPTARLLPRALAWRPLVWIGLRSYGVYLWHWPVFMLTRPQLDVTLDGAPLLALRLGLTFLLAELSYRFVETPIRRGALGRVWKTWRTAQGAQRRRLSARWGTLLGTGAAFSVALGIAVAQAQPPPPPDYLAVTAVDTMSDPPAAGAAGRSPGVEGASQAEAPATSPTVHTEPASAAAPHAPTDSPHAPPDVASEVTAMRRVNPERPSPAGENADPPPTPAETATDTAQTSQATPNGGASPATPLSIAAQTRVDLNLRAGPDRAFAILRTLPNGDPITLLGKSETSDWYKVRAADGTEGWVLAEFVVTELPTDSLALVEPPPLPVQPSPPAQTQPSPQAQAPAAPLVRGVRVSAIGDSVMLGAAPQLQGAIEGVQVDAALGRQTADLLTLLRARSAANQLADVVVIHMGNNGTFTARQFDDMMSILGSRRRVIVVTAKVPRAWQTPNNAVFVGKAADYPNVRLVDWAAATANRPDLYWSDGIHLRPEGATLYAKMIADAILGR